ncbi:MAG: dihydropteroate synthase [Vibrio sp.]
MGILNATPDSFSDGGRYNSVDKALKHAQTMIEQGATMIDVGGESTRPGASEVSVEEELSRVIPVVEAIRQRFDVWISVDTSKAIVMQEAAQVGMDMINDIRSLTEPNALETAAKLQLPVCIMHMQGQPKTMQDAPSYDDVFGEVTEFLTKRIAECVEAGLLRNQIVLDPGFGFGKTLEHNYQLLSNLAKTHRFGLPVLSGLSRKTMIHKLLDVKPQDATMGSVTGALLSAMQGAQILRVHDVLETKQALDVWQQTSLRFA